MGRLVEAVGLFFPVPNAIHMLFVYMYIELYSVFMQHLSNEIVITFVQLHALHTTRVQ